jgi:hypothetical protein
MRINGANKIVISTMFGAMLFLGAVTVMAGFSSTANASQCVKNMAPATLTIRWFNASGKLAKTNSDVKAGQQTCLRNANLGHAAISCNACAFAAAFTKVIVSISAEVGAAGICAVSGPIGCAVAEVGMGAGAAAVANKIGNGQRGKIIAIPLRGKTIRVCGNAFGLKLKQFCNK